MWPLVQWPDAAGSMAWFRCAVGHVSAGIFMDWLRVFSGMSWCLRLDWDFPCVESADFLLSQEPFKSQTWENIHVTAVLGAAAANICLLSAQRWCVSLLYIPKFVLSIIAFYFLPCITSACLFFFLDSSCWRHIMCQNFLRGSTAPLRTWRRWTVWSKGTASPAALLRRRKFHALL